MFAYKDTHYSTQDGSPAMLLLDMGDSLILVNEDGFSWTDPSDQWKAI